MPRLQTAVLAAALLLGAVPSSLPRAAAQIRCTPTTVQIGGGRAGLLGGETHRMGGLGRQPAHRRPLRVGGDADDNLLSPTGFRGMGDDRFEKIFYDGLALIAGVLPKVYVPEYENLIREHRVEMWLQSAALWIQRVFFLAFPVILIFEATLWFRSDDRSLARRRG